MAFPSVTSFSVKIDHARFMPIKRVFSYHSHYYLIDVEKLEDFAGKSIFHGYNKRNIFSILDKDYLFPEEGLSVYEKLKKFYKQRDVSFPDQVFLVTAPRVFGYVFNPVHFYIGYRNGLQTDLVVEINNTFGERHVYLVDLEKQKYHDKEFHVSPFFSMDGDYAYKVQASLDKVSIEIDYAKEGQKIFYASLKGVPGQDGPFYRKWLPFFNYGRILWQAGLLFYKYKVQVYTKPKSLSPNTFIGPKPNFLQKFWVKLFLKLCSNIEHGYLTVKMPDHKVHTFGNSDQQHGTLDISAYSFFSSAILGGDIAFGRMYEEAVWSSPDLTALLRVLAQNVEKLEQKSWIFLSFAKKYFTWKFKKQKNSIQGSKKNIESHYDLGNDFFELLLDRSMNYSCAIFDQGAEDISAAQIEKMKRLKDQLTLSDQIEVLEIGSGWGGLSTYLAPHCKSIKTITLSKEQKAIVEKKIQAQSLGDQMDVELVDYRNVQSQYDRIVSVEMIEAVGKEYLETYFSKVSTCLKQGGIFVLQGITMADFKYKNYSDGVDWIQRYIFPGSHIPTRQVVKSLASKYDLKMKNEFEMGHFYVKTLQAWKENMLNQKEAILSRGYTQAFIRQFEYYLSYCEAGFIEKHTNVYQWSFEKLGEA